MRAACDQDTAKGKRERAVLEFLLSTGARVGEVPDVKIADIDFVSGTLMIYGHKDREYREVYLDDAAKVHIKRYLDSRQDDSPYLLSGLRLRICRSMSVHTVTSCRVSGSMRRCGAGYIHT